MASYNIHLYIPAEESKGIAWYPIYSGEERAQLYIATDANQQLIPKWTGFHTSKGKFGPEKSVYTFLEYNTQDMVHMIESAVKDSMKSAPAWCQAYKLKELSREALTPKVRLNMLQVLERQVDGVTRPVDLSQCDITTLRGVGEEVAQFSILHVNGVFFNANTKEYHLTLQLRVLIYEKREAKPEACNFLPFLNGFNIQMPEAPAEEEDPLASAASVSGVDEEAYKQAFVQSLHKTRSKSGILKRTKAFGKQYPKSVTWAKEVEKVALEKLEEKKQQQPKPKKPKMSDAAAAFYDLNLSTDSDSEM